MGQNIFSKLPESNQRYSLLWRSRRSQNMYYERKTIHWESIVHVTQRERAAVVELSDTAEE